MKPSTYALIVILLSVITSAQGAESTRKGVTTVDSPDMKFEQIKLSDNRNEGCALADLNNDGKTDVIAGPYWYAAPDWKRHNLREIETDGEFMYNSGDHAMDVDGDGWIDIISGSWFSDKSHWFQNPGVNGHEGTQWEKHLIAEGNSECEAMMLVDIDQDGTEELIMDFWNPLKPILGYRLNRKEGEVSWERHVIGKNSGHGLAAGDIDGDGKVDLITMVGWYRQGDDPFGGAWEQMKDITTGEASTPGLIMDVNGDGRNDYIYGLGHDFGLYWMEQGGTESERTWTQHLIDEDWSQAHTLAMADLDGDGEVEIVTGKRVRGHAGADPGGKEPPCLFRYTLKDGKFTRHTISFDEGIGTGMQINPHDFDGDGKIDIAVAGKSGTYLLLNRGLVN